MKRMNYLMALAPLTLAFGINGTRVQAQAISVVVDNRPVVFSGTAPIQRKGAVLVPLRGSFEAIGATVDYDQATKCITVRKGESVVSLSLAGSTATVNGASRLLSPAAVEMGGSTLIPLRFVAEAFGDYVQWDPSSLTVEIQTPESHLSTLPPPPDTSASGRAIGEIIGQLTGVYTNTVPEQITVRVNGENTTVPITSSSVVQIRRNDQTPTEANIRTLEVGDQVRVKLASDRSASVIEAVFGEIVGTVKTIQPLSDSSIQVNLNDGTAVQMSPDAELTMAGRHILYKDIMPSDRVRIRTDQSNKIGYSIDVVTDQNDGNIGSPATDIQSSSGGANGLAHESHAPIITGESPAEGATVATARPVIYALFADDAGTGINQLAVRIKVDGVDVTSGASITNYFVTYQPPTPLAVGQHTVELSTSDSIGNHAARIWSFSCGQQRAALKFTSNLAGRQIALTSGEKMELTLNAQPGGSAFVTIGSLRLPLTETTPGVYSGTIKPGAENPIQNAEVTAHYSSPEHICSIANLQQTVSIDEDTPTSPLINSPAAGQQIGNNIQISGLSSPGSVVDVTVNYSTKALGIVAITGTAASTQVVADTYGKWNTDKIALSTPSLLSSPHDMGLTITAIAVDAAGQQSRPSTIKVMLQ